jgi:lambda repressor-like predicted transcriptional regulator
VAQEANRRRGHALAILHASGMSLREIGAEVGLSYEGVRLLILAYEGRS